MKLVIPEYMSREWPCIFTRKKKHFYFKNVFYLVIRSINFIRLQPLSMYIYIHTHTYNMLCEYIKNIHKALLLHILNGCVWESSWIVTVANSVFFKLGHHFTWLTNYGYTDLSICQTFSWKWIKWEDLDKENNCQSLMSITKFELSSKN